MCAHEKNNTLDRSYPEWRYCGALTKGDFTHNEILPRSQSINVCRIDLATLQAFAFGSRWNGNRLFGDNENALRNTKITKSYLDTVKEKYAEPNEEEII